MENNCIKHTFIITFQDLHSLMIGAKRAFLQTLRWVINLTLCGKRTNRSLLTAEPHQDMQVVTYLVAGQSLLAEVEARYLVIVWRTQQNGLILKCSFQTITTLVGQTKTNLNHPPKTQACF